MWRPRQATWGDEAVSQHGQLQQGYRLANTGLH